MENATATASLPSLSLKPAVARPVSGDGTESAAGVSRLGGDAPVRTVPSAQASEQFASSENGGGGHRQEVAHAVQNINEFFQMVRRTLQFAVNEDSGRMVIQVKDIETDEVIRQIPPEEVLELTKRLDEFKGFLFREKA